MSTHLARPHRVGWWLIGTAGALFVGALVAMDATGGVDEDDPSFGAAMATYLVGMLVVVIAALVLLAGIAKLGGAGALLVAAGGLVSLISSSLVYSEATKRYGPPGNPWVPALVLAGGLGLVAWGVVLLRRRHARAPGGEG